MPSPLVSITLDQVVPAGLASDYGLTNNTVGGVNLVSQLNAENLVVGGYAQWGAPGDDDQREAISSTAARYTQVVGAAAAVAATSNLVGNATNLGETGNVTQARLFAVSTQAGSVKVEHSADGVNWFTLVAATALVANTPVTATEPIVGKFVRLNVANTAGSAATVHAVLTLTRQNS